MIRLEQTEDEYLVAIPPEQRERAKRIRPRDWDKQRQRWVYPREARVYEALIAEFAEDAAVVEITRPRTAGKPDLRAENEALQKELAQLRQTVELITQQDGDTKQQVAKLQEALAEREQRVAELQQAWHELEWELDETEGKLDEAEAQIRHLNELLKYRQTSKQSLAEQLKQHALEATGGDNKFAQLLERVDVDRALPLDIARAMENELRALVGPDTSEMDLYKLIREATDLELMPLDAIDLAHLIRKQRNLVAHKDLHKATYLAREIVCLFAAALLWPEFPE